MGEYVIDTHYGVGKKAVLSPLKYNIAFKELFSVERSKTWMGALYMITFVNFVYN